MTIFDLGRYPDGRPIYLDRQGQPLDGIEAWGKLRDDQSYMRLAIDDVDHVTILTVWQGIQLALGADPPLIFETRIFGGQYDLEGAYYETEDEALLGHSRTVQDISEGRPPWYLIPEDEEHTDGQ